MEKYKKMSQIEHVLNKPSMYIGNIDFIKSKQFVLNNDKIIEKEIDYNPALYKICDELIVNSYDQSIQDLTLNEITAKIDNKHFSIFNNGISIPIEKHSEYKIYIPELIFGYLLTSSNYDVNEERITGGTFGIGAKASNIFSKKFIVEVWNKNKYYKQIFENNLSIINKPIIEENKSKLNAVKITCYPDFKKFNCSEFSDDMQNLILRRLIDLTALVRENIKITINDKIYKTGFNNYLLMYANNWINGSCIKNKNWYFSLKFNDNQFDNNIAFVNGLYTLGGTHIEYFYDLLLDKFQKLISLNINKRFLKDNLTVCLITSIINPSFNSQSKEILQTPSSKFGFECNISNSFWKEIESSELLIKLKEINEKLNMKQLSKFDATKKNKIKGIPKLEDAVKAGTKDSLKCTLILTEGDSAKTFAISGLSAITHGRDYYGVYPLRGKLLNVREASINQLNTNQEIIELKKIMGFKTNVKLDELRYGSILLMMDADEDGSHIKGLIINFLNYFYPDLLKIKDFLKVLVTPIVKVFLKNEILNFSNLRTYNNWLNKNDITNYKIKYYKGLGTSTATEAKEYFKNIENNILTITDKNNQDDILLAFAKDKINERKIWLINYDEKNILEIDPPTNITINEFINKELIHFSNYDNLRSIPCLADGFKPSQRKILFGCLKKNLKSEMKVAQLASYIAEVTSYHHGEQSLVETIINMAQDFVGSNNINLLKPIGQFGTRLTSKDAASGRYIFTCLNDIVDKIFKKDDQELLIYRTEEDQNIEPYFYLPIIPMILINGAQGIGTGFSTFIPNYNLNDIINWFTDKLENKKPKKLHPKYNNFIGNIFFYDDTTYISSGIYKIDKDKIIVTELPVKLWTSVYKEELEDMMEEGLIKSYINYSSDVNVHFEIKPTDMEYINKLETEIDEHGLNGLAKFLKLYKTLKISNMTLYDENLKLKTYNSVEEICESFYKMRLPYYQKRKDLLLDKMKNEIDNIENQIKFILLVRSNNKIFKMEEKAILNLLIKNKINNGPELINMSFKLFTIEYLTKLENKIKDLKSNQNILKSKTDKELWLMDLNQIKN